MPPRKVALVTGSGKRRVGSAVAEALAAKGYSLALHYRTSAAEAAESVEAFRARGVEAVALRADLADERPRPAISSIGPWPTSGGSTSSSTAPPSGSASGSRT